MYSFEIRSSECYNDFLRENAISLPYKLQDRHFPRAFTIFEKMWGHPRAEFLHVKTATRYSRSHIGLAYPPIFAEVSAPAATRIHSCWIVVKTVMKLKTTGTVRSELRASELHSGENPSDEKASSSAY